MKIIYDRKNWKEESIVATVGFFDGVHSGHRFLIRKLCDLARERQLRAAVITFPVHPRVVLHSDYQPKLLNSFNEKMELLSMTGIDYVMLMDFSTALATLTARDFIISTLAVEYHVKSLLIGFDHRFGFQRSEEFEQYVVYGRECDMEIVRASAYNGEQGIAVSSSVVRRLIEAGDVATVSRLLGYHYQLKGHVIVGHQVGRKIGFPTANIALDEPLKVIPRKGSYAVWITMDGGQYKGMLYIGSRPTFENDDSLCIEVNIFDFSKDIYDESIIVEFVAFIREDCKFNSPDELRKQMEEDKDVANRELIVYKS